MLPEMSVVVVADRYDTIRETMKHLRAQTARHVLEIVIVVPSVDELGIEESDLTDFLQVRVVEVGRITSTGGALAAGVRQAAAPVVAFAEEHSYPDQGWAEALNKAHRQTWTAVGGVILNANPGSLVSWAHLFTDFAPFLEPAAAGETTSLPLRHTAYKRDTLLAYGPDLDGMVEIEGLLHRDLRARGCRLFLEPAAKARHVNISNPSSYLLAKFYGARLFGAARAEQGCWSILRRLTYICAVPLIPLVCLWRILWEIRRPGRPFHLLPCVLPLMMLGLIAHAIGEGAGYALGSGDAAQRMVSIELDRYRHVTEQDRRRDTEESSAEHR